MFPVKIDLNKLCEYIKNYLQKSTTFNVVLHSNVVCVENDFYNRLWLRIENSKLNDIELFESHYNQYEDQVNSSGSGVTKFKFVDYFKNCEDLYKCCYTLSHMYLGDDI